MRTILPLLIAAALLAPVAMAGGPGGPHGEAGKAKADERRAGAADADDASERDRTSDHENRTAARASFDENRTALRESFLARLHAVRGSWLENATKVREDCKADNESEPHCIRDGYRGWRAEHRAQLKELRAELRALFESFHAGRRGASD